MITTAFTVLQYWAASILKLVASTGNLVGFFCCTTLFVLLAFQVTVYS